MGEFSIDYNKGFSGFISRKNKGINTLGGKLDHSSPITMVPVSHGRSDHDAHMCSIKGHA